MTKEQVLALLKDSISTLEGKTWKEFIDNKERFNAWKLQSDRVTKEISTLNSCDSDWIGDEIDKWKQEKFPKKLREIKENMINLGIGDMPK